MPQLTYIDVGSMPYASAVAMQERLRESVRAAGGTDGYLLLGEHDPPVITLGRRARREAILAPYDRLADAGVEVHQSARGGLATCHGPGQLVAYLILHLRAHGYSLAEYVGQLEEAVLRTARAFGVEAHRTRGRRGVWVGREKLATVGVAVSHWVTWHGLALNVSRDLSLFDLIVPCGLTDAGVTSLSDLLDRNLSVDEVKPTLLASLSNVFTFDTVVAGDGTATD